MQTGLLCKSVSPSDGCHISAANYSEALACVAVIRWLVKTNECISCE